jgi:hypothetical protein
VLQVLDRQKDAITEYQEITKRNPKDGVAHLRLGDAFRRTERTQEALSEFQQAFTEFSEDADFRPHYVVAHLNLAAALMALQRPKDAIAEYRKAIDVEPKNSAIHVTLGFVLRDAGDKDAAIEEFQEAIKIKLIPHSRRLGRLSPSRNSIFKMARGSDAGVTAKLGGGASLYAPAAKIHTPKPLGLGVSGRLLILGGRACGRVSGDGGRTVGTHDSGRESRANNVNASRWHRHTPSCARV